MSAPLFLTVDEFLEILLAELPAEVFAKDYANDEDEDKRSSSSAEFRTICTLFEQLSTNLETIWGDKFLSKVSADGLVRWEKDYFSTAQDSSLSIESRRQNIIAKIRSTGGISLPAIRSVVASILDPIPFDLLPYSGQAGVGAWILGASQLGYETWLSALDPINGARTEGGLIPLDCSFDYVDEGLTADQLASIQRTAYTYEVRIYGNASAATLAFLDARLTQLEPARSTHVIRNNQTFGPADTAAYAAATPEFSRLRI